LKPLLLGAFISKGLKTAAGEEFGGWGAILQPAENKPRMAWEGGRVTFIRLLFPSTLKRVEKEPRDWGAKPAKEGKKKRNVKNKDALLSNAPSILWWGFKRGYGTGRLIKGGVIITGGTGET